MATARIIPPKEDFDPALVITITSTGVAPAQATLTIQNGQQVTFRNMNAFQGTITFVLDPVNVGQALFNTVTLAAPPSPNSSKTISPNPLYPNRTVNYTVTFVGDPSVYGPYAIQVGTPGPSPLFIAVANGDTTPDPAVIPPGGWIEMVSMDGLTYNVINWAPSDLFTPPLTQVNPGIGNNNPVQGQPPFVAAYRYTITPKAATPSAGHGGGTIRVGGN
jgi:hypothetical protein